MKRLLPFLFTLLITSCASADPTLVARAVEATLTAVITPTPIVVVVTAAGGQPLPTVTEAVSGQQTQAAATLTLAASPEAPAGTPTLAAPTSTGVQLNAPTPTSSVSATLTASPTPTASPLPNPASLTPPAFIGDSLYTDDFTQPQLWPASDDATQRIGVAEGQLSITLKTADRFTLIYDIKRRAGNFYASTLSTASACKFRDRHGLLFRLQGPSDYYQFEVDCDGRYRLAKIVGGALTALKDWTPNAAILKGENARHLLGVRAQGDTLEIFVNGVSLTQITDSTFSEGGFGFYAGAGLSTTYTATFDDLQVWELKP